MTHSRTVFAAACAATLWAAASHAAQLSVTVAGLSDSPGRVMVAIVDSKAAFDGDDPPVASFILPAMPGSVNVSTDALAEGALGVRVMVDGNGNGEMDSNILGMPSEPWGFSNDAVGNFGPPAWEQVKFDFAGDTSITINLNR